MPNVLGDSENYVMANPMQTPPAIKIKISRLITFYFSSWTNLDGMQNICFYTFFLSSIKERKGLNPKQDSKFTGHISINNSKVLITHVNLLRLISKSRRKALNEIKT